MHDGMQCYPMVMVTSPSMWEILSFLTAISAIDNGSWQLITDS